MKILILCTGNSCRSQMAHGIIQHLYSDIEVFSAGTNPTKQVNPYAIMVMHEIGIDISHHTPTDVTLYLSTDWDCVITVCGNADERCPTFSGKVKKRYHIGFEDPSDTVGNEEMIIAQFRSVRDQIYRRMEMLFGNYPEANRKEERQ